MQEWNGEWLTDDEIRERKESSGQGGGVEMSQDSGGEEVRHWGNYNPAYDPDAFGGANNNQPVSSPGGSPNFNERIGPMQDYFENPSQLPHNQSGGSVYDSVSAFTSGNDPNPGGRFPTGSYLTPDEARERGMAWVSRPGEPSDLRDPYHYQTQDESTALGRDWATQQAIRSGNAVHAGFTPSMSPEQIRALGRTTPDEISAWIAGGGDPRMTNPRGSQFNPMPGFQGTTGYQPFQNGSPLFDDPASRLLEDYALDQFGRRMNPDPNSGTAMFENYARQLMDTLGQPVYSSQDEAIIKGQALNSINQEESNTLRQWLDEIQRRGLRPSDGPALDGVRRIKEYFNQARNTFETEFAKDAIAQTRNQRTQQLGVAGQLATAQEARMREAGTYAAIPKQLQDNSFQQGLQLVGAGGSPQSALNSMMQLAQMNQQQDAYNSAQRSQLTQGLLQYLGYLFGGQ